MTANNAAQLPAGCKAVKLKVTGAYRTTITHLVIGDKVLVQFGKDGYKPGHVFPSATGATLRSSFWATVTGVTRGKGFVTITVNASDADYFFAWDAPHTAVTRMKRTEEVQAEQDRADKLREQAAREAEAEIRAKNAQYDKAQEEIHLSMFSGVEQAPAKVVMAAPAIPAFICAEGVDQKTHCGQSVSSVRPDRVSKDYLDVTCPSCVAAISHAVYSNQDRDALAEEVDPDSLEDQVIKVNWTNYLIQGLGTNAVRMLDPETLETVARMFNTPGGWNVIVGSGRNLGVGGHPELIADAVRRVERALADDDHEAREEELRQLRQTAVKYAMLVDRLEALALTSDIRVRELESQGKTDTHHYQPALARRDQMHAVRRAVADVAGSDPVKPLPSVDAEELAGLRSLETELYAELEAARARLKDANTRVYGTRSYALAEGKVDGVEAILTRASRKGYNAKS